MTRMTALLLAAALIGLGSLGTSLPAHAGGEDPRFSAGWRFDQRSGPALYAAICAGCHMPDGRGAMGAARYPALAGNPRLAASPYLLRMVLKGGKAMPAFASVLDDAQISAVANEVLRRFGPAAATPPLPQPPITREDVSALRAAIQQEDSTP